MKRRKFLLTIGVTATAVSAGCLDEVEVNDEQDVSEQFLRGVVDGDRELVMDLAHEDSSLHQSIEETTDEEWRELGGSIDTVEVEQTETLELEEDQAQVEITAIITENGREETETIPFELRRENGEWKVWHTPL